MCECPHTYFCIWQTHTHTHTTRVQSPADNICQKRRTKHERFLDPTLDSEVVLVSTFCDSMSKRMVLVENCFRHVKHCLLGPAFLVSFLCIWVMRWHIHVRTVIAYCCTTSSLFLPLFFCVLLYKLCACMSKGVSSLAQRLKVCPVWQLHSLHLSCINYVLVLQYMFSVGENIFLALVWTYVLVVFCPDRNYAPIDI